MFAQTQSRPDIARVAEETVLNLKQLESRIEVLRNDLAALCTVLGHPEAARIAVTPPSWLGITPQTAPGSFSGLGSVGSFGHLGHPGQGQPHPGFNPYASQAPLGNVSPQTGQGTFGQLGQFGQGQPTPGMNPYASPVPFGNVSPWTGQGPYGNASPWTTGAGIPPVGVPPYGAAPGFGSPFQAPFSPYAQGFGVPPFGNVGGSPYAPIR